MRADNIVCIHSYKTVFMHRKSVLFHFTNSIYTLLNKMKSFISIIFLFLSLLVCARAFGVWAGGCKVDDDCGETECCVKQFGGYMGQCLRRPQEGENCIPENKYNRMFQQVTCPCAEGLKCLAGSKNKLSGINYSSPPKCRPIEEPETTEPASEE